MVEIQIDRENTGRRLDKVLFGYLNAADSAFLHKMLRKKNIVLNGKKAEGSARVKEGDVVTLFLAEETLAKFRRADADAKTAVEAYKRAYETVAGDANVPRIHTARNGVYDPNAQRTDAVPADACRPAVLYEDDALLLVNKPQGVLSQKDRSGKPSLNEWAVGYLLETGGISEETLAVYTPSVANRLDRNTSGLMVVTKTRAAARAFAELQKQHAVGKRYHAVVCGKTNLSDTVFETVEACDLFNKMKVSSAKDEDVPSKKRASMMYNRLAYWIEADLSLVSITLTEGRKHQIRAQMANLGYPVLFDDKYGDQSRNRQFAEHLFPGTGSTGMQLLHSFSLTFPEGCDGDHPLAAVSGKTFVAPHPAAFEQMMLSFYEKQTVVYILQCKDTSLYCGWTNDIAGRIKAHNEGKGAKYTRGRGPVHPLYLHAFDTKEEAMKEEARIKALSREEKLALIR